MLRKLCTVSVEFVKNDCSEFVIQDIYRTFIFGGVVAVLLLNFRSCSCVIQSRFKEMNFNLDTTDFSDVHFSDFVKGMIEAKLDCNVLEITGSPTIAHYALRERRKINQMHIRSIYTEMWEEISLSTRPAIVTGTSGIGMTSLRNFIAFRLLHEALLNVGDRRIIVFQTGDRDKHNKIVMERTADTVAPDGAAIVNVDLRLSTSDTFDCTIFATEPGEVYRLIDIHKRSFHNIDFDTERIIMFTSPDGDLERYFVVHNKARVFYLPLWSREECVAADVALKLNIGTETVSQRYFEVGGKASLVLETDPNEYKHHLERVLTNYDCVLDELNVLRGAASPAVGHYSYLYYDVPIKADGTYDYQHAVLNFGSIYILLLVGKVLSHGFHKILDIENCPYHTRDTPYILGHIIEGCAAHYMAERGLAGLKYTTLGKAPTTTNPFLVNFETDNRCTYIIIAFFIYVTLIRILCLIA